MHEPGEGADRAQLQETIDTIQLQLDLLRERVDAPPAKSRTGTGHAKAPKLAGAATAAAPAPAGNVRVVGKDGRVSVVAPVPSRVAIHASKSANRYVPYRHLPAQAVPAAPSDWRERVLHDLRWVEPMSVLELAERFKKPKADVADVVGKLYAAGRVTYLTSAPPPPGQVISDRYWNIVWVAPLPADARRVTADRRRFIVWLMLRCACGHAELRRATGLDRNALDADLVEIRRHEPVWDYGHGTKNNMYAVRPDWRPAPKGSPYDGTLLPHGEGGRQSPKRRAVNRVQAATASRETPASPAELPPQPSIPDMIRHALASGAVMTLAEVRDSARKQRHDVKPDSLKSALKEMRRRGEVRQTGEDARGHRLYALAAAPQSAPKRARR